MAEIEIIPAPLALKPRIEEMSRATFEEHRARQPWAFPENGFEVTVQPNIDVAFQGATREEKISHTAFVAVLDSEFAGYVILSPWVRRGGPDMPYVNIDDIAVLPEFRRTGVARALLRHVTALSDYRDWDSLQANVWAPNTASAALFASEGFTPACVRYRRGPDRQARDYPTSKVSQKAEPARLKPFFIILTVIAILALVFQVAG